MESHTPDYRRQLFKPFHLTDLMIEKIVRIHTPTLWWLVRGDTVWQSAIHLTEYGPTDEPWGVRTLCGIYTQDWDTIIDGVEGEDCYYVEDAEPCWRCHWIWKNVVRSAT